MYQPLTVKDENTQVHYFNNIYNMRIFKNTITVRLDILDKEFVNQM